MSKLSKLVRHPGSFFQDAFRNLVTPQSTHAELEATVEAEQPSVPSWFQADIGPELRQALTGSKPVFLYIPWIAEHGNMLIDRISDQSTYTLAPLDFIRGTEDNELRRSVLRFARATPHLYRRMIVRRLVPLRNRVNGIIFTFDWPPVMRIIASVCEELEIPRILIPHESVFVDRDKYYWDPFAHGSIPVADVTLGWGGMQQEIFVERGYPTHRFLPIGTPKFDPYKNYKPQLSRAQYCRLFGLDPARKIILFASQPLDSQLASKVARKSQCDAISDLLDIAEAKGMQLIVRLPPSKDNILEAELEKRIELSSAAAVDNALCYLVSPEEALYHADLVTSVNSTMLFEGLLLGRPPLSVKYVAFDSIWAEAGILAANNTEELIAHVDQILFSGTPWQPSVEGVAWAARMFSNGEFDGQANVRIRDYLRSVAGDKDMLTLRPNAVERIFAHDMTEGNVNIIGASLPELAWETTHKYLMPLLKAKVRLDTSRGLQDIKMLASVDVFVQFGSTAPAPQAEVQAALGRPRLVVEKGFLPPARKVTAKLSYYFDDTTSHDDATRPSRLQRLLESGPDLTSKELLRCRKAISKIVRHRISQHNDAPYVPVSMGTPGRPKSLMIDQTREDATLASGLASADSFHHMLQVVTQAGSKRDILIQLPFNLEETKGSHLSNLDYIHNLYPVKFEVHPRALIDLAEDVYVVTSLVGFDALMAGKTVHCFGAPFYAGWGATQDHLTIPGRTRRRSVEEIFHFAYIESCRYFHPKKNMVVEIEEMLDFIIAQSGSTAPVAPEPNFEEPIVVVHEDRETDLHALEPVENEAVLLPRLKKDADLNPGKDDETPAPDPAPANKPITAKNKKWFN